LLVKTILVRNYGAFKELAKWLNLIKNKYY
jgi:hypothetical protein